MNRHKTYAKATYGMRLIFLGTSGALPTATRGLSCTCIERDGEIIMFDAGECAQTAYARAGLGWNKEMRIFISHMHGDHCIGILGLIQTMSMQRRSKPLEIFGPSGIEEFVTANIRMLNFVPPYPITINSIGPGEIIKNDKYEISACKASHSITALSYLLREKSRQGRFDAQSAKRLGVPEGRLWGRLQRGQEVTIKDRIVRPDQVLGKERPGKTVGISGDTMPSAELERFFTGCDYLVFDATFLDGERQKAAETRHSTAAQAASFARSANVRNLILTHFSARYKSDAGHLAEAQEIHPCVRAAADQLEIQIV